MMWYVRQVCRGRIYASRGVYPLGCIAGMAATGGIYAAPTSQPILFIIVYGRGRGDSPEQGRPPKTKTAFKLALESGCGGDDQI